MKFITCICLSLHGRQKGQGDGLLSVRPMIRGTDTGLWLLGFLPTKQWGERRAFNCGWAIEHIAKEPAVFIWSLDIGIVGLAWADLRGCFRNIANSSLSVRSWLKNPMKLRFIQERFERKFLACEYRLMAISLVYIKGWNLFLICSLRSWYEVESKTWRYAKKHFKYWLLTKGGVPRWWFDTLGHLLKRMSLSRNSQFSICAE